MCGEEEGHSAVVNRLAMYPASMGVHKPPFCCLTPWQMGSDFVFKCKTGVFQYVVVRFFNSILTMILFTLGLYKEGSFSISQPFLWITAVNFCSQSWALYSLLLFFLCAHKELHGMRPFSKFACIKLIIFFSWWQALLIGIMVRAGRINQGYGHSAQEIAVFIRATLISAEMVLAAVAFVYAFPVNEFALSISVGARSHSSSHSSGGKKLKHISFTRWNTATAITASAVSSLSKGCQQLLPGSTHHASNRMNTSSTSTLGANPRGGEPAVVQPLAQKLLQQASKVLEYWSVGAKGSNATAATDSNEPERCGTKTSAGTTWANKNTIRLPPGGSCDSLVSLLAKQRDYQHIHSDLEAGVQLSDLPLENELRHHAETEAAALSSPGQAIIMLGELRALEGFDSEGGEQSKPLKPLRSPNKRGGGCAQVQDEECILAEEEEEEEG